MATQLQVGKKTKTLESLGFRPISSIEFIERGKKEVLHFRRWPQVLPTEKHRQGRPPKQVNLTNELVYETINDSSESEDDKRVF